MKSLVILVASVAAVLAAPQRGQDIAIVRLDSDISPDGAFSYAYEGANGIRGEARGQPVGADSQSVQGSFSYVGDDGQTYSVQYNADENGFQPQGAHLPTPPPIPEAILKSLEFNRLNPEPEQGISLRSG